MKYIITKGSAFDNLGFTPAEAENLKIRAVLMSAIETEIKKRNLTQAVAAELLDITQSRVSDLMRGKIHLFTIDSLINMLSHLKKHVEIIISDSRAA